MSGIRVFVCLMQCGCTMIMLMAIITVVKNNASAKGALGMLRDVLIYLSVVVIVNMIM